MVRSPFRRLGQTRRRLDADGRAETDFWEEVYIPEGSFTDLTLGEMFTAGMYACRPPGMPHGPWSTDEGVVTFEVRYHSK